MTITSASAGSGWFLNGLATIQRQEEKTQRDLSSGYSVHDASDAPAQTQPLIALESRLNTFKTWQSNLAQVKAEANTADDATGQAVSLVEQARVLAVRGATATATAADRQDYAVQVGNIQEQLVSLANTTAQGRYIFGGDQDGAAPYALNNANANGVSALTTGVSTRTVTGPDGESVYSPLTAAHIFDNGTSSAFLAVQNLKTALQNNDQPGIDAALQSLQPVSDWLNQQQASYGIAEQRIDAETNSTSNAIVSLQTGISAIRDTDVAQAAIDLTRESTAQSAAVSAQAEVSRKSLFDYLG